MPELEEESLDLPNDGDFEELEKKQTLIRDAIRERNVLKLKRLAIEAEGLLTDEYRRKAWPIILELDDDVELQTVTQGDMQKHKDYNQVSLDVPRSFARFPVTLPKERIEDLQRTLFDVIMRVLIANPDLHYYQGYHDICVTVLLVVDGDEDLAVRICNEITRRHLSLFMEQTMESTLKKLKLIFPTIQTQDEILCNFLERSTCGVAFCVSWYITWFGHDINQFEMIARIYDFFLAEEYLMPVYLSAVLVLAHGEHIKELECALGETHSYLAKITNQLQCKEDLENYISLARKLAAQFPEKSLEEIEEQRLKKLEEERLLEKKRIMDERRKREEYIKWQRSFVGGTYLWFRRAPLSRSLISAAVVISIAVIYQRYRKSFTLEEITQ